MNTDGSPTLASGAHVTDLQLAKTDTTDTRFQTVAPPWGIFLNGTQVLIADSIVGLEFRREWRIADYPLEQGAFESYDKVSMPFEVRIRLTKGGSNDARAQFLAEVLTASTSLNLYDVLMPDGLLPSVNIAAVDYARTARNGVGLLTIDLAFRQVRVTATAAQSFTATDVRSPSAASPVNGGTPQAAPAPPALTSRAVGH